jgi:hypothetical protein
LRTVLAPQQAQDGPGEHRRTLARARSLLDELDQITVGLLEGTLPEASIRRRPSVFEAKLEAVLDAIELRAAVELAKRLQVSRGRGEHEPARTPESTDRRATVCDRPWTWPGRARAT